MSQYSKITTYCGSDVRVLRRVGNLLLSVVASRRSVSSNSRNAAEHDSGSGSRRKAHDDVE
jgi:hypothetical protein